MPSNQRIKDTGTQGRGIFHRMKRTPWPRKGGDYRKLLPEALAGNSCRAWVEGKKEKVGEHGGRTGIITTPLRQGEGESRKEAYGVDYNREEPVIEQIRQLFGEAKKMNTKGVKGGGWE